MIIFAIASEGFFAHSTSLFLEQVPYTVFVITLKEME
jgi:hypothetical protein